MRLIPQLNILAKRYKTLKRFYNIVYKKYMVERYDSNIHASFKGQSTSVLMRTPPHLLLIYKNRYGQAQPTHLPDNTLPFV